MVASFEWPTLAHDEGDDDADEGVGSATSTPAASIVSFSFVSVAGDDKGADRDVRVRGRPLVKV